MSGVVVIVREKETLIHCENGMKVKRKLFKLLGPSQQIK
jgi:hypothetical protein